MDIGFSKVAVKDSINPHEAFDDPPDTIRKHVARELHDQIAQPLVELVLEIERLKIQSAAGQSVTEELGALQEAARHVLRTTRELQIDMRGHNLRLNFVQALKNELRLISHQELSIQVSSRWPKHINGWAAFNLLRIAQQAVINASRHGRATAISIFLDIDPGGDAVLVLLDNGIGVNGTPAGMGMLGMQERATILGGTFSVSARETGGTRVEVRVPMERIQ